MKKYLLLIIGLLIILGLIFYFKIPSESVGVNGEIIIKNNSWKVKIVKDDQSREAGLSGWKSLPTNQGMLFVFDTADNHYFWMKDMLIPLDMVFFDSNWQIVEINSNLQPNSFPQTFGGGVKSLYVLEINAKEANSLGLKVGDKAIFLNK